MVIHIVKKGDSLYNIGQLYNVDYRKIASDNEIPINQNLVVGQTIIIITDNTPNKIKTIEVNGFAFPNINEEILKKVLSSLTYLSIFSYHVNPDGSLTMINDDNLIALSKNYKTLPAMVITNIGNENRFNSDLAHSVLNNKSVQNRLINNILDVMRKKGYSGLNIDFEYVYPSDRNLYINFINKIKDEMKRNNYFLSVAVAPKKSDNQQGLLYEAHDYSKIGIIADFVIIMTYEWGYSGGPAMAIAPIDSVMDVLDYAITRIPSNKIMLGIPNYGYDWTLPYIKGTLAKTIGNYEAVDIARNHNQAIDYNQEDQAPYFHYYDSTNKRHEVWFDDARSIRAKLELPTSYNLKGISFWTLNRYSPQAYLLLRKTFNISKHL